MPMHAVHAALKKWPRKLKPFLANTRPLISQLKSRRGMIYVQWLLCRIASDTRFAGEKASNANCMFFWFDCSSLGSTCWRKNYTRANMWHFLEKKGGVAWQWRKNDISVSRVGTCSFLEHLYVRQTMSNIKTRVCINIFFVQLNKTYVSTN